MNNIRTDVSSVYDAMYEAHEHWEEDKQYNDDEDYVVGQDEMWEDAWQAIGRLQKIADRLQTLQNLAEFEPITVVGKITSTELDRFIACGLVERWRDEKHKEKEGESLWRYYLSDTGNDFLEALLGDDDDEG